MKKIGILTFQFADNYGAILQATALYKTIEKLDDCTVEIINYIPPGWVYGKAWNSLYTKKCWEEKQQKLQAFLRTNCKFLSERVSVIDTKKYDYYCVGSDQIWNTDFKEYFLPNLDDSVKKISYAASIGRSVNDAKLNHRMIKEFVSRFDKISVRESEHVKFIEELCGKECVSVLDPTLLLDEEEYESMISKETLRTGDFIFFYWLSHISPLYGTSVANRLSVLTGLPVVHFQLEYAEQLFYTNGGCMKYEGIEEFLWYIKNAKYVVTNSYHGAIFSIIFKKNFWVYPVESMKSRIDTLEEKLGIGDRIMRRYHSDEELLASIDYTPIYLNLEKEKTASLLFLNQALDVL